MASAITAMGIIILCLICWVMHLDQRYMESDDLRKKFQNEAARWEGKYYEVLTQRDDLRRAAHDLDKLAGSSGA